MSLWRASGWKHASDFFSPSLVSPLRNPLVPRLPPHTPHPFHASCPPRQRLLTCGTCANKSRLVPRHDPSITGREHLKITWWEATVSWAASHPASQTDKTDRQTDQEGERKGPRADVINCPKDEYPITVRLRNEDGAAVAPVINAECSAWLILKCKRVFNQGHMRYDQLWRKEGEKGAGWLGYLSNRGTSVTGDFGRELGQSSPPALYSRVGVKHFGIQPPETAEHRWDVMTIH